MLHNKSRQDTYKPRLDPGSTGNQAHSTIQSGGQAATRHAYGTTGPKRQRAIFTEHTGCEVRVGNGGQRSEADLASPIRRSTSTAAAVPSLYPQQSRSIHVSRELPGRHAQDAPPDLLRPPGWPTFAKIGSQRGRGPRIGSCRIPFVRDLLPRLGPGTLCL